MSPAALALAVLILATVPQPERCVAGELALPPSTPPWTILPHTEVGPGRTACFGRRATSPGEFSGAFVFRATPKGTPAVADHPHPRLLAEVMAELANANIRIGEPKWRRQNVPFRGPGMEGFGNGTMFGFDGAPIEGDEKVDVIVLVFDGPTHHYDVALVGPAEAESADEWKTITAAFSQMLNGLNRVKR